MLKRLQFFVYVTIIMVFGLNTLNAQQWMKPKGKENPSFFEIQKEFNEYWKSKGIVVTKDFKNPELIKGKGWKPFKRWEWFMSTRVDKNGYFDGGAIWKGYEEKKANFSQQSKNGQMTISASNWTNLGPQSAIPTGGGAGRVNFITFHPSNSNIIWVGSPSGGVWKTTDGGSTWSTNTDELPNSIGASSLAVDPSNTNTMYLGTGDRDAGDTYAVGVLKSTDGGATWNSTGLSWTVNQQYRVSEVIIHPTSTGTVIAATTNGIWKTTDGGASWTQTVTGNFKDLVRDPNNASIWYAGGYNAQVGVWKSSDTGSSWTKLTTGLPSTGIFRTALGMSGSTLYALYCNNSDYGLYGIYKSTNGGSGWTQVADSSPNLLGWQTNGADAGGQGWYDLVILASPSNANTVLVGGVNVWRSTDGGVNWTCVGVWNAINSSYVHADHHALEFLPGSGTTVFSGNDGGFFKSTDTGTSWTDRSNGLGIHQYYRLGTAKTTATPILGGAQDNGTDRYNGTSWARIIGGDGMECIVDYSNSNIQYGELYYGDLYRTTSGGTPSNMSDPSENGAWVTPYVLHPSTNTTMYYATQTRVYKGTNVTGTPSWTAISGVLGSSSDQLTVLAVAPSNGDYVYAANSTNLWKSTNANQASPTFTNMTNAPDGITYVGVHPSDPNTVYITLGGYTAGSKVYRSVDGGSTWSNVSGTLPNIPANCVAINPNNANHVYVGTDLGVFLSTDAGGSWSAFDTGLPNVIVNELEINTSIGKIRAATYGRGMWESPLESTTTNSITVTAPNGGESLTGGNSTNITWSYTGTISNVKLEYSTDGGSSWNLITSSTANDGSEAWSVPNVSTTQGRVRVSDASNSATNDISNNNFTITASGGSYASLPYSTGFESGSLDSYWTKTSSNAEGRIVVTTSNTPRTGSYHLRMDDNTGNTVYAQNEAWLRVNLSGYTNVDLSFWWKSISDETHTQDGVYFSSNGGSSFVKVHNLNGGGVSTSYANVVLDVDALASANGLSLTSTFVIKFQQYDNYPVTSDGMAFDDISVTAPASAVTIFSEDFETNAVPGGPWTASDANATNGSDYWGDQSSSNGARVHGGSWSAYCADNSDIAGQAYDNYMDAHMTHDAGVSIGGYTDVKISFWLWYSTESGYDYVSFQYYNPSTAAWVEFTGGKFTGSGTTWSQKTFSVPSAAGTTFKFRWLFHSDLSVTAEGVYVDDIAITGVPSSMVPKTRIAQIPKEFALKQNYPNPFNPVTNIQFDLPTDEQVVLNIYDITGQMVRTLVNENRKAGSHKLMWDGRNDSGILVSSGMYIYRIKAGSYIQTKRMTLIK